MDLYLFGYGSLVHRASLEASVGPVDAARGPWLARLHGHRRAWNVQGHSNLRPDYRLQDADGADWQGHLRFLGLAPDPTASTLGTVWRLDAASVARLDDRERSYRRVDVTADLDWAARPAGVRVQTYYPTDPVDPARPAPADAVIMARYLRLVDQAYATLGARAHAEHRATMPAPDVRVAEISAAPVVEGTPNLAVDPAAP